MELTASDLWDRILDSARSSLPEQSFRTWFQGTEAVAFSEDDGGAELLVEAPSRFHVEWLEDKYGRLLGELGRRALGRPLHFTFQSDDKPPPIPALDLHATPEPTGATPSYGHPTSVEKAVGPGLNERYTFERFVVGNHNQLAAAACKAVSEKPARMYNPLFLYGGVGLGKTHLMHAIGHEIRKSSPRKSVAYVSSEHFMNELVSAIQDGTTSEFRRRFRRIDLLLVDDVHFLEGKERTQEEFFHTFNALYDAQRQIVLTSDRPPKELPGLEARLVSRFEWGLVADIRPPDFETRVAILRKKAADDEISLDGDVIDFIARSCTASVRELEGAVIKLLAYSSLKNKEVTPELARTALEGMIDSSSRRRGESRLRPEVIRDAVAERWQVRPSALASRRRTRDLTVPRQIAMYLIKDLLDLSLVGIGEIFGGRDHSTVIHSIRKVERTMEEDEDFRHEVDALRATLLGRR